MKNSKIKLLSVAACLALVGTASAAWAYGGTATKSEDLGVRLAAYADAGSITVTNTDNVKIVLDNGKVSYSEGNIIANYVQPTSVSGLTFNTSDYTIKRTYTFYLSDALSEYITYEDASGDAGAKDEDIDGDGEMETTITQNWTDNVAVTLPTLVWQDGKCPSTEDKTGYLNLLDKLAPGATSADDWDWSTEQNKDHDATSADYYAKIIFKAVVTKNS